jgi:hypothetical protein
MSKEDKDEVPWETFDDGVKRDTGPNETGPITYAAKHAGLVGIYTFTAAVSIALGLAGGGNPFMNYSFILLGVVVFTSGTLGMLYKVVADGVADGIDS